MKDLPPEGEPPGPGQLVLKTEGSKQLQYTTFGNTVHNFQAIEVK